MRSTPAHELPDQRQSVEPTVAARKNESCLEFFDGQRSRIPSSRLDDEDAVCPIPLVGPTWLVQSTHGHTERPHLYMLGRDSLSPLTSVAMFSNIFITFLVERILKK